MGATGVVWALDCLGRVGAVKQRLDLTTNVPELVERNAAEFTREHFGDYAAHGSLLFGEMGTLLVAMRIAPSPAFADAAFPAPSQQRSTDPRIDVGPTRIDVGLSAHGGDDAGAALACALRDPGDAPHRGPGGDRVRAAVDAGPLWQAPAMARTGTRLCGQHGGAAARLGLADGRAAGAHRRRRAADLIAKRGAIEGRRQLARGCITRCTKAVPALSWCARHGHGLRGRAVRFADHGRAAAQGRRAHVGGGALGQGTRPLSRNGRQRLCLPQAAIGGRETRGGWSALAHLR